MPPIRILHLHGRYYATGGAETYVRALLAAQRQQGHRAVLAYLDRPPSGIEADGDFLPPSHGLRTALRHWPRYRDFCRAFAPDVIHLHGVQYDLSPLLYPRLARIAPVLMTIHDTLGLCFKPARSHTLEDSARVLPDGSPCTTAVGLACVGRGCAAGIARIRGRRLPLSVLEVLGRRRAMRGTARQIVNSRFLREDLVRNGFRAGRIRVVRPPVAPPPPLPAAPEMRAGDAPVLLYVGRLARIKGVFQLLEAMSTLAGQPWKLVMVGEGEARAELAAAIRSRGLEARVAVLGPRPRGQMGRYYTAADVLVLPSLCPESWGLVGPEAMSFGLPVVAYASGAIPEWLSEGETGRLVPPGDVRALAAAIGGLLADPGLRRRLGAAARRRAQAWSAADHVAAVDAVYAELIGA